MGWDILAEGLGATGNLINGLVDHGLEAQQNWAQNKWNANQANKQRDWASNESQINRDFQERMSNTAVTRKVADMKNAGINPMAMFAGGGASVGGGTPQGSTSSGATAQGNAGAKSNLGKHSAGQLLLQGQQIKSIIERNKNEMKNLDKRTEAEVARLEAEAKRQEQDNKINSALKTRSTDKGTGLFNDIIKIFNNLRFNREEKKKNKNKEK